MQRLREIPQEVYDFLRNFRLRAGDLNRDSPGCLLLPLRGNSPCGGSKTAPFTHPLPGVPAPLAGVSILQQTLFWIGTQRNVFQKSKSVEKIRRKNIDCFVKIVDNCEDICNG